MVFSKRKMSLVMSLMMWHLTWPPLSACLFLAAKRISIRCAGNRERRMQPVSIHKMTCSHCHNDKNGFLLFFFFVGHTGIPFTCCYQTITEAEHKRSCINTECSLHCDVYSVIFLSHKQRGIVFCVPLEWLRRKAPQGVGPWLKGHRIIRGTHTHITHSRGSAMASYPGHWGKCLWMGHPGSLRSAMSVVSFP